MNRKFLRENVWLFVLSFVLLTGIAVASFFYVEFLTDKELKSRQHFLANQGQICGNSIIDETDKLQQDVDLFVNSIDFESILSVGKLSSSEKAAFRQVIAQNQTFVDTLYVYSGSTLLKAYRNEQNYFFYEFSYHFNSPEAFNNTKQFYTKAVNLTLSISFKVNPVKLFENKFKDFFIGENAHKFIYTEDGGIIALTSGMGVINADNPTMSPEDVEDYRVLVENNLQGELMQDIVVNNKEIEVISTLYPLQLFDTSYGIIFSEETEQIISGVNEAFRYIFIVSLGVILLIIIVFTASLMRISQATRELGDNKLQLSSLVRQQQLLLEHSDDFTYRHDKQFEYNYISENVERVLGFTPEEFSKATHRIFSDSPINRQARKISKEILEGNTFNSNFFVEMLDADGVPRVLEVKEKPYLNEKNEVEGVIGIAKDVSEKFRSDEKFRILFEYSTDPHVLYDENGILDCNEATVEILKVKSKKEILNRFTVDFSPVRQPDERLSSEKMKEMRQLAIDKGAHRFEWTYVDVEGSSFPTEVSLTPVSLNNKQIFLAVWHDLTERKRVENTLIDAKQRAEDLADQKQQFLSSMSHEIRTPLNAVIGYAHILLNDKPREDQVERLKTLEFSANNLLSLVNDVLDLSKIESGKIEFDHTSFDIIDRLNGIKETFHFRATEKGLNLTCNFDEKLPRKVIGDAVRLNQALTNIIGNAIKFTEKGGVTIDVKVLGLSTDTHKTTIEFIVTDTGIGISEQKQQVIFESFVQADAKILNTFGGTGLGLAITKKIIDLQGGTIQVESELGKGSVFRFKLDFDIEEETSKDEEKPSETLSLSNAHILLVEDNLINQKIASQFLSKWGAIVEVANNGKEGLDMLRDTKDYDIVLMDLNMPIMDGFEATKAIRSYKDTYFQEVPIIALTADAFTEVRDKVLDVGMSDYITKPINPALFNKVLIKHLNKKHLA
tara:strand:- start:2546 stop:5404 length:2859 start_codon:yes stop_codon:yes gene_type:complete